MIKLVVSTLIAFALYSTVLGQDKQKSPWEIGAVAPTWSKFKPTKATRFEYQKGSSAAENGERLKKTISKLEGGDRLIIDSGRYEINELFDICLQGKPNSPIFIEGNPNGKVIITRKDAEQNVINIGFTSPSKYIYLGGLEITGGSTLLRLGECENIWIDKNKIYHGSNVGIAANSKDTREIFITNNEIYDPGKNDPQSTAEGMYLGGNEGKCIMSFSVIANNHVYNCRGTQGDGIELKQGSYQNWIFRNYVHDCNFPCITVYGTGNQYRNQIEGNLVLRSNDNAMQVQGDANVLQNIVIQAKGAAFSSNDHQGKTGSISVTNNTFINNGQCVKLGGWDNRKDLKFAQNIAISETGTSVELKNKTGVILMQNFTFGKCPYDIDASKLEHGLLDLNKASWDGKEFDIRLRNMAIRNSIGAQIEKNYAEKIILKK